MNLTAHAFETQRDILVESLYSLNSWISRNYYVGTVPGAERFYFP